MQESSNREREARYHLVVLGELPATWADWLDSTRVAGMTILEGRTVLDVRVPDQSALLALLQRLHALHLPLLVLALTPA